MISIIGIHAYLPGCANGDDVFKAFYEGAVVGPDFAAAKAANSLPWCEKRALALADAMRLRDLFEFDPKYFGVTPRDTTIMDPQQRKLLQGIVQAFCDAGISLSEGRTTGPIGCFVGAGVANYLRAAQSPPPSFFSEDTRYYIGNDLSSLALRAAYLLDLRGTAYTILSTCSSALVALSQAVQYLERGDGQLAIAAGAYLDFFTGAFAAEPGGIISPTARCRPLANDADGTYFSNGICVLLLATSQILEEYKLTGYCHVRAVGTNNDGRSKAGYTAPSLEGQSGLIKAVCARAGLKRRPDIVELHGTGTKVGDPIELNSLAVAYEGLDPTAVRIGSSKSNFGHLNAAAGGLGAIKTVLSIQSGISFSTVSCEPLTTAFPFAKHSFEPAAEPLNLGSNKIIAGVSSFGIGGTNAHVILEGEPEAATPSLASGGKVLVLVGAHAKALVTRQAGLVGEKLRQGGHDPIRIAYTCRLLFDHEQHKQLALWDIESESFVWYGRFDDVEILAAAATTAEPQMLPSWAEKMILGAECSKECKFVDLRSAEGFPERQYHLDLPTATYRWLFAFSAYIANAALSQLRTLERISTVHGITKVFENSVYML